MIYNHLFASCLPRNQENQTQKTDPSSALQCELSLIGSNNCIFSTQNIDLKSHPSYSPDFAPNEFFLFPFVKNKIRGQGFSALEEAVDGFRMHVLEMPQSEWQMGENLENNKAIFDS